MSKLEESVDFVEPNMELIALAEKYQWLDKLDQFYSTLMKRKPFVVVFTFAGIVKQKKQDRKEALRLFMEAWKRDPNYKFLLNTLGDFFLEENKILKAKQYLEMSLFLYPHQETIKEKLETLK